MTPTQRLWAAASRALRPPSLIDRGLHVEYPLAAASAIERMELGPSPTQAVALSVPTSVVVSATGNPRFSSEHLVNTEVGYRVTRGSIWSLDVVAFSGRYDDLQTVEPLPPVLAIVDGRLQTTILTQYENRMRADTYGAEVAGRAVLRRRWQVDAALSTFHLTPHANGSQDPAVLVYDGHAPSSQ